MGKYKKIKIETKSYAKGTIFKPTFYLTGVYRPFLIRGEFPFPQSEHSAQSCSFDDSKMRRCQEEKTGASSVIAGEKIPP